MFYNYERFSDVFTSRLKKLLDDRLMTQAMLAELTGHTEATISRYVNGSRCPKAHTIRAISKALGCTADYLLGLDDEYDILDELTQDDGR